MKAQKKQPELRFKGFTDDWEQSKLKDMAESLNYGLNVEAGEYDGRNKYIRITDINDVSRKFTPDPITSPNVDNSELNDDYKLQLGDVLFARTGASVSKTYHYESSDGNLYYAGFLIRARIKTAFSSMFLYQFTWGQQYKRFVNVTSQRSGHPGINAKEYGNLTLLLPNYKEQQKIGEFFQKLDHTITLQQRRLDLLKKLKQGYLQQMFPTKDEVIPQLRFNIFNGDWEQVKLSELVTKEKSYSLSRDVETEKETETRYIHYGDIHTGIADKITNKNQLPFIKEDSYESLLKGDLILADASEDYQGIAKPAIILETSKYRIVAGLHTIVLRSSDKSDSLYLYYLLKTKSFKRHGYRMGTGMKVFGITANNVLAFKTLLPSKKEQYRISQLLKIMDRLLALQQSKIKQLQQLKQAYLQKLFP